MATYYFDWDNGSDSNAGASESAPWKSYDAKFSSTADNDILYFKRGATQITTTAFLGVRNGFRMYAYGSGAKPRWVASDAAAAANMILNFSRRSNIVVEDQDFDATGTQRALYCAAQETGGTPFPTSRITFRRCVFRNGSSDGVQVTQEQTSTARPSFYLFEDCDAHNNGGHGIIAMGQGHWFVRCRAWENGALVPFGAHGFSARAARTEVTSGWTLASGTIYYRNLAAAEETLGVFAVFDLSAPSRPLVQNTSTPTTPADGEFGIDTSTTPDRLYVNVNANANGRNIVYAWGRTEGLQYIACKSFNNVNNPAAPYVEGHGFSADDWTSNTRYIGCISRDNEGLAFSFNRGGNNTLSGCVALRNGRAGLQSIAGANNRAINCLFIDNNSGIYAVTYEIAFANATASNCAVTNCVLIGSVSNGVLFDVAAPGTVTNCAINGYTNATSNATASGTITSNVRQWINSNGSLRMPGNPLATAGTYVQGVTLANGRLRPGYTPIGAYMAVQPRAVRV